VKTMLSGGPLLTAWEQGELIEDGALVWEGDTIVAAGERGVVEAHHPAGIRLDARGGLILPALVNLHHHGYSALAAGFDPGGPTRNFAERLDRLWWRLDRAHDEASLRLSAQLTALACIRSGCTAIFDHHSSPAWIEGSLAALAEEYGGAGLAALLGHEISDRHGAAAARRQLEENRRFALAQARHPRLRGLPALHASFTLRDGTLAAAAGTCREFGCHLHLAEDAVDLEESLQRHGRRPLERLEAFGLLGPRALLVHGVHLEAAEFERIARARAWLVHNPESNANNRVGRLDLEAAAAAGLHVGLGSDGMGSDLLATLRTAFLLARAAAPGGPAGESAGWCQLPGALARNAAAASHWLGRPWGRLEPGATADCCVLARRPPLGLHAAGLFSWLVYGAGGAPLRWVIGGGRTLLENGHCTSLDEERLVAEAARVAPALWARAAALPAGTPFLGRP
jgi:cytosine/adenosine deaminase-related metal-dependent hydrolase